MTVSMETVRMAKSQSRQNQKDFDGRYIHSLSLDATIMVSHNCANSDEHVVTIFVT